MKRLALIILVSLSLASIRADNPVTSNANAIPSADWIREGSGNGLVIHSRARLDSGLKEFKGVGVIGASPHVVFAVLDDTEAYPSFMPYTSECRF